MRRVRPGSGERVADWLRGEAEALASVVDVELVASQGWSSVTFSGERHRLRLALADARAAAAVAALAVIVSDPAFELPGHFLVDLQLVEERIDASGGSAELELSAITVTKS